MWPFKKKIDLKHETKIIDYPELLTKLQRNSIDMELIIDTQIPMGKSKFGGKPHLPVNYEWPYYICDLQDGTSAMNVKSRPLMFMMQINCSDIKKFDIENELPNMGILYFFYEMESQRWGFDPEDKGSAVVYYYDGDCSGLNATSWPEDLSKEYRLPDHSIVFTSRYNVPSYEEYNICDQGDMISWDDYDENRELYGYGSQEEYNHKLLGYADLIQGEMLTECQLTSNGIYCGNSEGYHSEKAKQLSSDRKDWILLAQISSIMNEDFELMFGDCGSIYFYIKKDDLKRNNFDKSWMILQCG